MPIIYQTPSKSSHSLEESQSSYASTHLNNTQDPMTFDHNNNDNDEYDCENNHHNLDDTNNNDIRLYLSRSVYPLNSSIVGTIVIPKSNSSNSNNSNKNNNLQQYKSIKVYIAGRCRVDSRWHYKNVQESIQKLYPRHPCHNSDDLPSFVEDVVVDCYFKRNSSSGKAGGAGSSASTSASARGGNGEKHVTNNATNNLNGEQHPNTNSPQRIGTRSSSTSSSKNQTFCFWSTNVMTLCQNGKRHSTIPMLPSNSTSTTSSTTTNNNNESKKELQMKNSTWYTLANKIEYMIQEGESIEVNDLYDLEYDDGDDDDDDIDQDNEEENDDNDEDVENKNTQNEDKNNEDNDDDDDKLVEEMNNLNVQQQQQQQQEIQPLLHSEQTTSTTQQLPHQNQSSSSSSEVVVEDTHFTFKADLPNDLPLTANAASARYFYSVVVVAQTMDNDDDGGGGGDKVHILQAPFTVVTSKSMVLNELQGGRNKNNTQHNLISSTAAPIVQTKIRIGSIHAIAHPTYNPISLSSTYEAEPWRTSVERVNGGWDTSNVRSIPIEEGGYKCGVLTIIGGVVIHPGEKVLLQFDFEKNDNDHYNSNDDDDRDGYTYVVPKETLPCYMVSACLQGEEYALSKEKNHTQRKKSRSYVFDTAYSHVDPDSTRNVSLNLSLPLDCPMTLHTDLVKIEISCRVDLTVKMPHSDSFKFLTVQFPCHVISGLAVGAEKKDQSLDEDSMLSKDVVKKIMDCKKMDLVAENGGGVNGGGGGLHECYQVICPEILDDLSMLTMHILECNK